MTPAVEKAIQEIQVTFPGGQVDVSEDEAGGAFVTVHGVELGRPYSQDDSWLAGHITYQYPYADVYPLFVRPDLSRLDGKPLGEALSLASFRGVQAVQISRRSNRLNPARDTAALKLLKVVEWLKSRP